MTCHSGGTLEINVEPVLPAPALWVVGTTPIAGALAELGAGSRVRGHAWSTRSPRTDAFPGAGRVLTSTDLRAPRSGQQPVRGGGQPGPMGRGSPPGPAGSRRCLRGARGLTDARRGGQGVAALRGRAARAGCCASITGRPRSGGGDGRGSRDLHPGGAGPGPSRARGVRGGTRAGDARRAGRGGGGRRDDTPPLKEIVLLDPVCGMTVDPGDARHLAEHEGVVYAFCSMGCRTRFVQEPRTLRQPAASPAVG